MRLKLRPDPFAIPFGASIGDKRKVTRFLFWPMQIEREWRWLETAMWREEIAPTFEI